MLDEKYMIKRFWYLLSNWCIKEFVDILTDRNIKCSYEDLMLFNEEYYDSIEKDFKKNKKKYYVKDYMTLDNRICFTSKRNNFIEFLEYK